MAFAEKGKKQQGSGTYRFREETLHLLNFYTGFDGTGRVVPEALNHAINWIHKNGKRHSDGSWGVEARLLQPGNRKDPNSLLNYARKKYPKGGADGFCKDILGLIRDADAIYHEEQKKKQNEFIRST